MKVILLSDQRDLGKRGQVIDVKSGFGRSYLLPKGIALEATDGNIKYFQQQRAKIDARHQQEREAAEEIADRLGNLRLEIPKRVALAETLYGSVTAGDIAESLEAKGFTIDRRRIDLEGGIKTLGDHPVRIELHPEVIVEVIISVVPEDPLEETNPAPSRWDDLIGPFYSASQVAQICGEISREALDDLRRRRAILGLKTTDGVMVYPIFQFDEQNRVIQRLPEVFQCFPAGYVDDWALAGWLVSPLRALDGVSVIQWLRDGKELAPVLVLARDTAHRLSQ